MRSSNFSLPSVSTLSAVTEVELADLLANLTQPIIIKGLVNDWPIVRSASQSHSKIAKYLLSYSEPMTVGVGKVPASENGRLFYNKEFTGFNFERSSCDFRYFLETLLTLGQNDESDGFYLGSTPINRLMPSFSQYNPMPALEAHQPLTSIWISNQTRVAAHQDFPNNVACCVAGKRRFTLFPPEQVANLYIGPLDHTPAGQPISLVDIQNADLEQYPKFEQALQHAQVAELAPGDALLIPSLWWHAVDSLTSFNVLINYWWQTTPSSMGAPTDALFHALLNIKDLPDTQKHAVKALFDHYVFDENKNNFSHIPDQALGVLAPNSELAARKIRSMLINKLNR